MNRVKKLQELRMISAFFKDDKTEKKAQYTIEVKETPTVPLINPTKKVHIVNKSTTKKTKPPSSPPPSRKTGYAVIREKVEEIKERWKKKKETIKAKQIKSSSIPNPNQSKIEEIKEKWKKKGATMD